MLGIVKTVKVEYEITKTEEYLYWILKVCYVTAILKQTSWIFNKVNSKIRKNRT